MLSSEIQVPSLLSVSGQQGHVPGRKNQKPLWGNGSESLSVAQRLPPETGLCAPHLCVTDHQSKGLSHGPGWAVPSNHFLCALSWLQLELWVEFFSLHIMF